MKVYVVNVVALKGDDVFPRLCDTSIHNTREEAEEAVKKYQSGCWGWLSDGDIYPDYGRGDDNVSVLTGYIYRISFSIIEVEV